MSNSSPLLRRLDHAKSTMARRSLGPARYRLASLASVLPLLGMPAPLPAQALVADSVAATLRRVDPAAWLRLAVADSAHAKVLEGRLVTVGPETFTLRLIFPPPDVTTIPLTDLRALWRKDGAHTWRGALIGGLALAALAAKLGAVACSDTGIDTTGCEMGGAAGGALIGGGIGALVGASYPRWRLVYERPIR